MRIRLLTASGPWSGAEVHTVALAEVLSDRGHDVAIVELGRTQYATRARSTIPILNVPVDAAHPQDANLASISTRRWKALLDDVRADVGILVKGDVDTGTAQLERAARRCFGAFLTIEHLVPPVSHSPPARLLGLPLPRLWLYRQRYRHWSRSRAPTAVIGVSEAVRATLVEGYGFPARKLRVVQNGVDVARFVREPAARAAKRAEWGVSSDALVFGSVSRLSPMKNQRMAIDAFAQLRSSGSERSMKLVFVGDGPSRDELETHARERGVTGDVLFPGFSDLPFAALCGLDVFVLPSHNEGLSLSMLEAMACECPPIATAVGGAPEVLNDASVGWLVRPGDTKQFHDAMREAASLDMTSLKRIGVAARERVATHFNAAIQFKRLAEMIETSADS